MTNRTTKTVWYKRARIGTAKAELQSLLSQALKKKTNPFDRLHSPNGSAGTSYAINRFGSLHNMLTGQFLSFLEGQRQPTITLQRGVQSFDLDSIAASREGNAQKEFLEGIAYFAVHRNHVLLIQTQALGSREFERYLNWLRAEAASVVDSETVITIVDQPSTQTQQRLARKQLRGVTIGTPLRPVAAPATRGKDSVLVYEAEGRSFDTLRSLLGADIFQKVKMTEALDADSIHVQVTIRVKGKRSVSDDTHAMLDALAGAARHLNPEDVALEVQGIGTVKGEELKIHKGFSVELLDSGGLVNEDLLWEQLHTWLLELIEDGFVPT